MLIFRFNNITEAFYRLDQFVGKVLVDFIPERIYMYVYKIRPSIKTGSPDLLGYFNSFKYLARMAE
jgi:hypothetical protein